MKTEKGFWMAFIFFNSQTTKYSDLSLKSYYAKFTILFLNFLR